MTLNKSTYNFQENSGSEDELTLLALQKISQLKVPSKVSREKAWGNFVNSLPTIKQNKAVRLYHAISIAASICLFVGIVQLIVYVTPKKYNCERGQQISVILPDNSEALLNADTQIKFNEKQWNKQRKVWLQGEAFFKVAKGKQFDVVTNNGTVSVLGTQFNVFSRNEELKVFCKTGKVSVNANKNIMLTAGMEANVNGSSGKVTGPYKTDGSKALAWQKGEFWFTNAPITKVLNEIERQYNISIEYYNKPERVYSGFFTNNNLAQTLDLVCIPMQFKYEIINNNKVIIK